MANIVFTGQGFRHIVENIFLHLEFGDLVAVGKKGGCELISKWCHEILENPNFWLKKWTKNGLTPTDKVGWTRIIDLAKNTNQEHDVLKFIKKVIQRGHFVSIPCFIQENDLERFLNFPKTPYAVYAVNLAMDKKKPGIVQLMAPELIKSLNALNRDGVTPIGDGETPIIRAAKEGSNQDIVKILAPLMVNPNNPDTTTGKTPIFYAAKNGDVEIVEFLASLTDEPNVPDMSGDTPIHNAAKNGHVDVIRVLAGLVDNPNVPDMFGDTPIHCAAWMGHVDVIRFLAALVDNPNLPGCNDITPIHYAAVYDYVDIVRFLADLVDNPNTLADGWTPIDLATSLGHQEIVDVLNQYVEVDTDADDNDVFME